MKFSLYSEDFQAKHAKLKSVRPSGGDFREVK